MRNRNNGGLIGATSNLSSIATGVFSSSEVAQAAYNAGTTTGLADSEPFKASSMIVDSSYDPYYSTVMAQFPDLHYSDNIMRDKSVNRWDENLGVDQYYRNPLTTYFGPKQTNWCTHFYEDGYYTVADNAALQFGTGAFTIECWVKLSRQDGTQYYLMGRGGQSATNSGTGWVVYLNSSYQVCFYDAVSNVAITNPAVLNRDQWYHIAIVRTNTATNGLAIYVDGVASTGVGTSTGNFNDTSNPLYIGRDRQATQSTGYWGKISDVRITSTEIYGGAFTRPSSPVSMSVSGTIFTHATTDFGHNTIASIQPQTRTVTVNGSCMRMIDSPYLDESTKLTGHGSHSVYGYGNNAYNKIYDGKTYTVTAAAANILTTSSTARMVVGEPLLFSGTTFASLTATQFYVASIVSSTTFTISATPGGAVFAAGSGSGSMTATNNSLRFNTGAFTVEAWVYLTNEGGTSRGCIAGKGTGNVGAGSGWNFYITNTGLVWSDGATNLTSTSTPVANCGWYHIAAVREGTGTNQFKMYLNGVAIYTGTVSTDYSQTNELRVLSSRTSDYYFQGYICGLKLSKTARYTSNFTANQSMLDTQMTSDLDTSYLACTTGTNTPAPEQQTWIDYGKARLPLYRAGNELRFGQHHPYSRTGHSMNVARNSSEDVVIAKTAMGGVYTSNADFSFGTSDFSIEFWYNPRYTMESWGYTRILYEGRTAFNDSGICIRWISGSNKLDVYTNNKVVLSDSRFSLQSKTWYHIVVQRVSGVLALYINGKKSCETVFALAINNSANKICISNGSYSGTQYGSTTDAYFSDLRVLNGAAAYAQGTKNPENIQVPVSPLTAITNTVLLTFNGPMLKDYSGRNYVSWDRGNYGVRGGRWDNYMTSYGPYRGQSFDITKHIAGDTNDNTAAFNVANGPFTGDSTRPEFSWITRMNTPWTIEMFIYWHQSNPGSPITYDYLYNATTAGHEGFRLKCGAQTTGSSYNNVSFSMYTAHNSGIQYLYSSDTDPTTLQGHAWNHIAVVYDPTKSNKMALFINGYRTATSAAFTPGQKVWNTYNLTNTSAGQGGFRISDTPRYNNDATTYTVPTQWYTYDKNTFFMSSIDGPNLEKSLRTRTYGYGIQASHSIKAYPNSNGSMRLSNKDTTVVDRLRAGYGYWASDVMGTNTYDFTMEFWACWSDATTGGNSFNGSGNYIMHYQNHMKIMVTSTGLWQFIYGDTGTTYQTLTTTVQVATVASGRMDFIVWMRKGGNYFFYVNGVEVGSLFANASGTYSANGPTTNFNPDFGSMSDSICIGTDWNNAQATSWCGNMHDFRFSSISRYDTRVINGVATMVHRASTLPALPTRPFPTR